MEKKIIIATRIKYDNNFGKCLNILRFLDSEDENKNGFSVKRFYIVSNVKTDDNRINSIEFDEKIKIIFNKDPISPTAFNKVIEKIKEDDAHLLTFSKEVELRPKHIKEMIQRIDSDPNLLVVGYKLEDNILNEKERESYYGGKTKM